MQDVSCFEMDSDSYAGNVCYTAGVLYNNSKIIFRALNLELWFGALKYIVKFLCDKIAMSQS